MQNCYNKNEGRKKQIKGRNFSNKTAGDFNARTKQYGKNFERNVRNKKK